MKVTLDLDMLPPSAILALARTGALSFHEAARAVLVREGWNEEEINYVTVPGTKLALVNGHRKPTVSDEDFTRLWNSAATTNSDIANATGVSEETLRRRAKALGLGPRPRGRKPNGR